MDYSEYFDETGLVSPFYRVAAKAIIRDAHGRVLAAADNTGTYELIGGGWEHNESFEDCLRREIQEELGVPVVSVSKLLFTYRGRDDRPRSQLRVVAEATLKSHDFTLDNTEVTEVRFVDRDEFIVLNWCALDREVIQHVDELWPPVEKNNKNQ